MSILSKILAAKRAEVARAKEYHPLESLVERGRHRAAPRQWASALRRDGQELRIIAEYKRASPSAGTISDDRAIEEVANSYGQAGAAALSVLTEAEFFRGHLDFIERARQVTPLPILRKDFIFDSYQVVESYAAGADAILLIVAALELNLLKELMDVAQDYGLGVLVEVHDEREASVALDVGAAVIGVNHRDLATFEIDLSLTERLRGMVPDEVVLVGESGIAGPDDAAALARAGADAILVGEYLMRSKDPEAAVRKLRSGGQV